MILRLHSKTLHRQKSITNRIASAHHHLFIRVTDTFADQPRLSSRSWVERLRLIRLCADPSPQVAVAQANHPTFLLLLLLVIDRKQATSRAQRRFCLPSFYFNPSCTSILVVILLFEKATTSSKMNRPVEQSKCCCRRRRRCLCLRC